MALPMALLGLVAVSILVTGVMVTSSTEATISTAHQQGVRNLYDVEAGLEAYVSTVGTALTATGANPAVITPAGSTTPVQVSVSFLGRTPQPAPDGSRLYSLVASPVGGGRTLGALVRVPLSVSQFDVSIEQAFAAGSQRVRIGGSSFISGKQDSELCRTGGNVKAVTLSAEAKDQNIQEKSIDGAIQDEVVQSGMTRYQLEKKILGMTTREFARMADIKFGDFREIDRKDGVLGQQYPVFQTAGKPNSANGTGGRANYANPQLTPYNWGCPWDVIARGGTNKFTQCVLDPDTAYYPFVAINAAGGEVTLSGDHGQGILLIVNGNLKLQGSFVFKGLIIVDGATDIRGGGGDYKIEGAVVGFGDVTMEDPNDGTGDGNGSAITGDAVIRYNSCAIAAAQQRLQQQASTNPRQLQPSRTFSWYEIVR